MAKSKKKRAKDQGQSTSTKESAAAQQGNPHQTARPATGQPPPIPSDFYLRVEGINIGAIIGDTGQLSVARGASFLLREAITDIAQRKPHKNLPLLPDNGQTVSTGASIGEFILNNTDRQAADAVAAHIADYLRAQTKYYKHLSFGVCAEGYQPAAGEIEVRERALARIRFGQMQSPTCVVPPDNTTPGLGACQWDGRRPADAPEPIRRKGEKDILVSTSVWDRWRHGTERKQDFYRDEAALTEGHPAYPMYYSNDLGDLANWDRAGSLNGKVAVIYADGNRFSRIQNETCKRFESVTRFDETVKSARRAYLSSLLRMMADEPRFQIDAGHGVKRLRLETPLWGGDELKLVVPAWCGLDVLQHLFAAAKDWSYKGRPLTLAAGIVFCRAKTPIQRSMELASQLAEGVKAGLKAQASGRNEEEKFRSQLKHRFDYMVLESIDFPVENDLDAHLQGRYRSAAGWRRHLAPTANWPTLRPRLADLLERFPKGQAYTLARAAVASDWGDKKDGDQPYREARKRSGQVTDQGDATKLIAILNQIFGTAESPLIDADTAFDPWAWIHLAELWDYLAPECRESASTMGDQP